MLKSLLSARNIKIGIVLALIIGFVVIYRSSPSMGFLGAFAQWIIGILSFINFFIGIAIAIVVSIALFVGIFFAGMFFIDSESSREMYGQFKKSLVELVRPAIKYLNDKVDSIES